MSLRRLIRHMAKVEQCWFRGVMSGEQVARLYISEEDRDAVDEQIRQAELRIDFAARHLGTAKPI